MSRKLPRGVYQSGTKFASKVKLPTGRWMCRTFGTTRDAELWFDAAKEALREGRPVPDPRRVGRTGGEQYKTIADVVAAWMEYQYPAPSADGNGGCNPDTKAATARVARLHVLPRLGHLTLAEVTVQDVDELAKHLHGKLSFDYAEKGCWVLRASLHYAYQRGWVKVNVAALPGRRRRPVALRPLYLTLAETMRVSACLRPEYRIGLWVQRLCGLRVGELFGLQIEDVDLDKGVLVVWKQGGRKSLRADQHGMVDKLKEDREFRHVGIPECLVRPLRQHIRVHLRDATPATRLMPSILGGRSYKPYCDSVARAAAQAGIKDAHGRRFRTHWLRAATLTDLHRAGLNPRDISTVGGHSTKDPAAGSPVTYKYYVLDVGDVQVQLAAAAAIDQRTTCREPGSTARRWTLGSPR